MKGLQQKKQHEPFHEGEIQVQEKAMGKQAALEHRNMTGSFIRPHMTEEAAIFFGESEWLIASTLDQDDNWPRAHILHAKRDPKRAKNSLYSGYRGGFFELENAELTKFSISKDSIMKGDRFIENVTNTNTNDNKQANTQEGRPLGMLGIQLHTRRRNRVNAYTNAKIKIDKDSDKIHFKVQNSFGNCPKYIAARNMSWKTENEISKLEFEKTVINIQSIQSAQQNTESKINDHESKEKDSNSAVNDSQSQLESESRSSKMVETGNIKAVVNIIGNCDTFFIATGNRIQGADASHRGGPKGFVKISSDGKHIKWPDYIGNGFFNTLGNIALQPKIGLLFIDFVNGDVLQCRGLAKINFNKDVTMPGGQRVIQVELTQAVLFKGALLVNFSNPGKPSPFNPPASVEDGDKVELISIKDETHDVKTFLFKVQRPFYYKSGQYGSFIIKRSKNKNDKDNDHDNNVSSGAIKDKDETKKQKSAESKIEEMKGNNDKTDTNNSGNAIDLAKSIVNKAASSSGGGNFEIYTRAWTLSSTASGNIFGESLFTITVKNKQNGQVSPLLHNDEIMKNLEFRLMGIEGEFILDDAEIKQLVDDDKTSKLLIFGAAGSGITPVLSIIRKIYQYLTDNGTKKHVTKATGLKILLFYSVKTEKDIIFFEQFCAMAKALNGNLKKSNKYGILNIYINLTQDKTINKSLTMFNKDRIEFNTGRVNDKVFETYLHSIKGYENLIEKAFVCGPSQFANSFIKFSKVPSDKIVTESFDY